MDKPSRSFITHASSSHPRQPGRRLVRNVLTGVFFLPFVFAVIPEFGFIVHGPRIPAVVALAVVIAIFWIGTRFGESLRSGLSQRPDLVLALIVVWFAVNFMSSMSPAFAFPIAIDGATEAWCRTSAANVAGAMSLLSLLSVLCFVLDAFFGRLPGNDEQLQLINLKG
jgi:hypothetical protein